ncbi:MAG TPA: ABC transporter substrate-binding protein [Minicystis sp.]|nr:ABC transporter substrate-binding protein [Minicystis sp.]
MVHRRGWVLGMASALLVGALGLGCDNGNKTDAKAEGPSGAAAEWKVGAYLSQSGEDTAFGVDTKEGIELAFDEVNQAGGVKGKPFKVLYEDDKSNPQEASNKVLQLIDRDKVVAILGEVASSRSRAGGIVANKKKVPMITPSSTNPDVTKVGPFVFRNCFTDDVQGKLGADFIVDKLGKKKIAVLFASDDLYSSGLAKEFREEVKRKGGEIVADKGFLKKETNFTTFINEIKAANPEVIYAPIYYNAMAQIARQAKAAGVPGNMFVGGDGWDADELLRDAGAELEGAFFTNHYAPDVPWENSKKFVAKYKERFKRDPSSLAAQGYDAAKLLADAIGRSKATLDQPLDKQRDEIRQAIQDTKNFQGATGTITINAERNADKPVVVVQIKDKKFTYYSTVGGAAPAPAPSTEPAAAPASASASATAPATAPKK